MKSIIEQLAEYLASEGIGALEGNDEGAIFWGSMPATPTKAICVCGSDIRQRGDQNGARIMILVRSDEDGGWPLMKSAEIVELLDDLNNALFIHDGNYIVRVNVETGPAFIGLADNATQAYSINIRVFYC